MMRCEICAHECTVGDFVTLRNVCEHLYIDSLAKKYHPFSTTASGSMYRENMFHDFWPETNGRSTVGAELLPLKK